MFRLCVSFYKLRIHFSLQVINRLTGGGADYAFECIGDTGMVTTALQSCCDVSMKTSFHVLFGILRHTFLSFYHQLCVVSCLCQGWGLTVTLGVPKQKPEVTAHFGLLLNGRTLTGSLFGGWKPKSEIPSLVEMYLKKVDCCTGFHNLMKNLKTTHSFTPNDSSTFEY